LLQAVLFDMDGLLVSTEETWFDAETEVMEHLGGPWDRAHQAALVGGPLHVAAAYMRDVAGSAEPVELVQAMLLDAMERRLRTGPVAWMPGARELLVELAQAGVPCALVSASFRRLVDAVLVAIGQARHGWFVTSVAGDEVEHTKPAPDPYLEAAARLGADPRACVVLEDSPTGVTAGEAAGCAVVAVPSLRPIEPAPHRLVVDALTLVDVAMLRTFVLGRAA
jgi:HAD superfamily hydrolase (TIGR01509 family)